MPHIGSYPFLAARNVGRYGTRRPNCDGPLRSMCGGRAAFADMPCSEREHRSALLLSVFRRPRQVRHIAMSCVVLLAAVMVEQSPHFWRGHGVRACGFVHTYSNYALQVRTWVVLRSCEVVCGDLGGGLRGSPLLGRRHARWLVVAAHELVTLRRCVQIPVRIRASVHLICTSGNAGMDVLTWQHLCCDVCFLVCVREALYGR